MYPAPIHLQPRLPRMSQITRCPACSTYFKVVPDQLRVSQGWVRCGCCAQVFDGAEHLCELPAVQGPVPASTGFSGMLSPEGAVPQVSLVDDAVPPPAVVGRAPGQQDSPSVDECIAAPLMAQEGGASIVLADAESDGSPVTPPTAPASDALFSWSNEPESVRPAVEPESEGVDLKAVSFLVASRRKALWNSWGMRLALLSLALVFSLGLGVQVAIQDKDRLAAEYPGLKSGLVQLCAWARCEVSAWQNIDAVVIESSAFNRMKGDVYRFGLGLRNTSQTPVAMPAIELTLTDGQDQSVIRRVLTPQDLGLTSAILAGGQEWSGSLIFNISAGAAQGGRVAGYRVLAFYP